MRSDQEGLIADPDLSLVEALASGEDAALDTLMARYEVPIFHFVYRLVNNESDARNLTQETFVRLYFNVRKFRPQAKFRTWLYQIALNLCRDHLKSKRSGQAAKTDSIFETSTCGNPSWMEPVSLSNTPAEEMMEKERLVELQEAIASLPPDLREALVLTSLEGHSHLECARLLDITPKAVETRVYRARKFLSSWLRKGGVGALLLSCLNC